MTLPLELKPKSWPYKVRLLTQSNSHAYDMLVFSNANYNREDYEYWSFFTPDDRSGLMFGFKDPHKALLFKLSFPDAEHYG